MKKIILSIVTSLLLFTLTVNASETMYVIKSDGVVSGSAALWKDPGSNVFIDIVNLGEQVTSYGWERGENGKGYNYVSAKSNYSSGFHYGWIETDCLSYGGNIASLCYNCINEVNQIKLFISSGLYLEAIKVCEETLEWHVLSDADITLLNELKTEAANRYRYYLNSNRITGEQAIELIRAEQRERYGGDVDKFNLRYSYYDKGDYYLVCATATSYADGTDKYRVYKEGGRIEFIGSGSSWASDDSEYFV